MHNVEWQRGEETDEEGDRDPLVTSADGKHLRGDGPSDGQGIELLNLGAGPDVGSFS
jgi:hypothetical protein